MVGKETRFFKMAPLWQYPYGISGLKQPVSSSAFKLMSIAGELGYSLYCHRCVICSCCSSHCPVPRWEEKVKGRLHIDS